MTRHLPVLEPGWEYLYKLKKGTIVELYPRTVVEVVKIDGVLAYTKSLCGTGSGCSSSLRAVKLVGNNNKQEDTNVFSSRARAPKMGKKDSKN